MKLWLAGAVMAPMLACSASAQIPPELLGGGSSAAPMYSEPFYKGKEGFWVLFRDRANTGYHCSVNFITPDNTFSMRGPDDAEMARKHYGSMWFVGKAIPPAAKAETVQVSLTGNRPAAAVPAGHVSVPGATSGALVLTIDVQKSLLEKPDSSDMAVQMQGREVFRSKLIGLQQAYRVLGNCMRAAGK